jgi:hypothetical protein
VYRSKLAELDSLIGELSAVRNTVGAQLARAERAMDALAAEDDSAPRCELRE